MKKIYSLAILLACGWTSNSAMAEVDGFVAVHPVYCRSERDVIDLAEANYSGHLLRRLIKQKVSAGACEPPSMFNKKAGTVVKKFTPRRQEPYYCFTEEIEPGVFSPTYTCVIDRFIMPIKDYVNSRSGSYRVKQRAGDLFRVQCLEGGSITVQQHGNEFYRISDALQLTRWDPEPKEVNAGNNFDQAARDGCKGTDFLIE